MIEALRALNGLKKQRVKMDYAIGGGYAVNYYLEPILTYDLDIFVLMNSDEEYSALYRHFRTANYRIENVYVVIGDAGSILPSFISPLFDEAIISAKRIRVKGIPTKVLSVE